VPDNVARIAVWLHRRYPDDLDAVAIADALLLSALWTADDKRQHRAPADSATATAATTAPPAAAAEPLSQRPPDPPAYKPKPERPDDKTLSAGGHEQSGQDLLMRSPASRALPRQLELARSLRPFKRRWRLGQRWELDLDATERNYAYTRRLTPALRRAPERWFEAAVVVDGSAETAVWAGAIQEFTRLLAGLGAFRRVHTWQLAPDSSTAPLSAGRRRLGPSDQIGVPDRRRVVLVISDCSAPAWHDKAVWLMLRRWAASAPTALVNPLPVRLWHHTALDLPTARARAGPVGSENIRLRCRVPQTLHWLDNEHQHGRQKWIPLPVLTMTPRSLGRWAGTLMRADAAGCDAMLIPPEGRLDLPDSPADPESKLPASQLVDAFRQTGSPGARTLAALCSSNPDASLADVERIRAELAPKVTLTDIAEVLVSGLVDVQDERNGGDDHGDVALRFREGVPELLKRVPIVSRRVPAAAPVLPTLPGVSETRGPIQVALWGGPDSGKTTFLHALAIATAPGPARLPERLLHGQDATSRTFLRKARERFGDNRAFPGSTVAMKRASVEFHWKPGRGGRDWLPFAGSARQPTHHAFEFLDIPGMFFTGYPDQLVGDWLLDADALIYLFDPVAARKGGGGNLAYFHGALERLLRRADETGRFDGVRLPHRLAVCITKLDDPDFMRAALGTGRLVWDPTSGYAPRVSDGDAAGFFAWACSRGHNEEIIHDAIQTYFHRDRVSYYVTSSVGFRAHKTEWSNIEWVRDLPRIRGPVHAINVLEPLLDLAYKIRRPASSVPNRETDRRGR
jgi:hypothetical protein